MLPTLLTVAMLYLLSLQILRCALFRELPLFPAVKNSTLVYTAASVFQVVMLKRKCKTKQNPFSTPRARVWRETKCEPVCGTCFSSTLLSLE